MFSCLFHISELHEDSPNIIAHDAHGTLYCAIQCLATKDLRVVLKKIAASGLEILEHGALAIPHHSSLAVVLEASNVVGAIAQFLLPERKNTSSIFDTFKPQCSRSILLVVDITSNGVSMFGYLSCTSRRAAVKAVCA
jgi:hypothetical protein